MNLSTADYPYDGPERLAERKPYGWSPFVGPAFLEAHESARDTHLHRLEDGDPEATAMVERVRTLSRHAGPSGLERSRRLAEKLGSLRDHWSAQAEKAELPTGELLDSILRALDAEAMSLQGDGAGPAWVREVVETLAIRMETHGCVHASYDRRWRRTRPCPNPPEVVARLALAVAWLAWSDLSTRPTRSLVHLNALLKLNDLASAGLAHHAWKLSSRDRGRLQAAAILEQRLLRSWSYRAGGRSG